MLEKFEKKTKNFRHSTTLTYSISSKHVFIAVSDFDARKNDLKPDNSGSIFKGQITTPGKALQIKFPTSLAKKLVKCPGFVLGGMLKFRFEWRISWSRSCF